MCMCHLASKWVNSKRVQSDLGEALRTNCSFCYHEKLVELTLIFICLYLLQFSLHKVLF